MIEKKIIVPHTIRRFYATSLSGKSNAAAIDAVIDFINDCRDDYHRVTIHKWCVPKSIFCRPCSPAVSRIESYLIRGGVRINRTELGYKNGLQRTYYSLEVELE
jgi:hypothetical protein